MEKQEKKEGAGRRQTGQWGEEPTASLLAVMFFRAGIQHKQLPKCLPNFLCLADGVKTLIMGKLLNLSDPVCWGSGVLMVLPFLVLQLQQLGLFIFVEGRARTGNQAE